MNTENNFSTYQDRMEDVKRGFPLAWILQYTLSNADKLINIRLFNESISSVTQQDIDNVEMFLSLASQRNKALLEDIEKDGLLNAAQKNFLRNAALHVQTWLDMLWSAVYIEAEKWGFALSDQQKETLLQRIEAYETVLYGPRISDVPAEKEAVIDLLKELIYRNQERIAADEKTEFLHFLQMHRDALESVNSTTSTDQQSQHEKLDAQKVASILDKVYRIYGEDPRIVYEKKGVTEPYVDNQTYIIPVWLHRKEKDAFFQKHDILSNTKIMLSDVAGNFSVWFNKENVEHTIEFPAGQEYTFERVCELIDHEVGTHFVRNKNASVGIDVRSAWYLEIEEWIAKVNEQLATKNRTDLSAWEPTIHHISTYIAENCNLDQTKKLLTIYYKLTGMSDAEATKTATSRAERVKRYHANDLPGANRKDVVYRRGIHTVVEYLKDADLETLQHDADVIYRGKFADRDLPDIAELFNGLGVDPAKRISPLALGRILYERYQGNTVSHQALLEKDKRFALASEKLTYTQKKQLIEILESLKSIEHDEVD